MSNLVCSLHRIVPVRFFYYEPSDSVATRSCTSMSAQPAYRIGMDFLNPLRCILFSNPDAPRDQGTHHKTLRREPQLRLYGYWEGVDRRGRDVECTARMIRIWVAGTRKGLFTPRRCPVDLSLFKPCTGLRRTSRTASGRITGARRKRERSHICL